MRISIGTFNLNNLFSRWNFSGAVTEFASATAVPEAVTVRYEFTDTDTYRLRTFAGRLVGPKNPVDTERIAERIQRIDVDVLAVQEVEDIAVLREFNTTHLDGMYDHGALIEGNDPRFIDVGVMSKFPLGGLTSHQTAVHPAEPDERVFSRDLLEVDILDAGRSRKLVTLYVTHLKSKFVHFTEDPIEETRRNDTRRLRQAETIAAIVARGQRPDARYVILGDMNDTPDRETLAPLRHIEGRPVTDGLAESTPTRPSPDDPLGPAVDERWTHRFKPAGLPADYELFDQIWLSQAVVERQEASFIDRRIRLTGDGSDHDPAWVVVDL